MKKRTSRIRASILAFILALGALDPVQGNCGANGMAVASKVLGGALILIGVADLAFDVAMPATMGWKIPLDILMIAGGAVSLMNNSKTEEETRDKGGMPMGSVPGAGGDIPGMPTLPGGDFAGTCAQMGSACTCTGENCSKPQLKLPSVASLKDNLTSAYKSNPGSFPDGFSLDQALKELDENYDKAQEAADSFNTASNSGAFAPSGDADLSKVADNDKDKKQNKDGLQTAGDKAQDDSNSGSGSDGTKVAALSPASNLTDLINKAKKDRGELVPARVNGLDLEDSRSGRVLTIFERVSRAIRGSRDRDIVLAKIEWTRHEAKNKELIQARKLASESKTALNTSGQNLVGPQ